MFTGWFYTILLKLMWNLIIILGKEAFFCETRFLKSIPKTHQGLAEKEKGHYLLCQQAVCHHHGSCYCSYWTKTVFGSKQHH